MFDKAWTETGWLGTITSTKVHHTIVTIAWHPNQNSTLEQFSGLARAMDHSVRIAEKNQHGKDDWQINPSGLITNAFGPNDWETKVMKGIEDDAKASTNTGGVNSLAKKDSSGGRSTY